MDFKDKVVWITGASSGIGEALAKEVVKRGARVVISSNELDELERVEKEIDDPERARSLYLDLTRHDEIPEKGAEAIALFGRIDVLVNNGGISQRAKVHETSMDTYKKIMDIDFFGHVAVTKSVLPHMMERKSGHVAVTSSITGRVGAPLRSGYAAAKHALHGFFDTLRAEAFEDGVSVTIICPTSVKTNISYHSLTGSGDKYGRMSDHLAKGLTPVEAARRMANAIEREKEEVVIGDDSLKYTVLIKRLFPGLFSRILRKAKVN